VVPWHLLSLEVMCGYHAMVENSKDGNEDLDFLQKNDPQVRDFNIG